MSRPDLDEERIDLRLDREAELMIERANGMRLDEHESERFLAALENPPSPAPKLRKAVEKYRKALANRRLEVC